MTIALQSRLDELLACDRLPSPTGVGLSILQLTQDESASSDKLALVLQRDPALAGLILKYANSAQSHSSSKITTVNEAVIRLGTSLVRQLALGFSVLSNARSGPCETFDYINFWTRSLAAAVGCHVLSKHLPRVASGEAFTCGLLCQIGQLCLASVHPGEFAKILDDWDESSAEQLIELEQECFAIDHNQVSAALFADWGLPELFQSAVEQQEAPNWDANAEGQPQLLLARLLNTAKILAEICVTEGDKRAPLVYELLNRGEKLGLDVQTLVAACDEALDEWVRMGQVLEIITLVLPSMGELIDRARQTGGRASGGRHTAIETEARSLRILVVDADPAACDSLAQKLREADHELYTARTGVEALEVALQSSPQLIFTDAALPEMDGLELCRALRRSNDTAKVYVIVQSEQSDDERLVEAFNAGADDFMAKPVNHRVLAARLRAAQRLIGLQNQVEQDREEIRRIVNQLGIANRKLERLALDDELTGLPNRRYALQRLDQEWARSDRNKEPLLCMIADIDHFKKVNDTYGHDAGDIVLRETAAVMKKCLRITDVICRFGGEEFLAICPGADMEMAKILGNRIRAAVQNNQVEADEFKGSVTISVGVAPRIAETTSPKQLIKDADEALYAAKEAGRNKVCIVTSG